MRWPFSEVILPWSGLPGICMVHLPLTEFSLPHYISVITFPYEILSKFLQFVMLLLTAGRQTLSL